MKSLLTLLALFALATSTLADDFVPLINGKDFTGFTQHGGKALYRIENGEVIGTPVAKTPNSFMCTDKTYGDFILEFEFKVADTLNSGVQFRSEVFAEAREFELNGKKFKVTADRVHGYQFELDPSARAWTGGIYDEGRRGWLNDLKNNEPARKAFKNGAWNSARIECRGDSIKTWLNGVPAADLKDSATPRGLIALQVHGIQGEPQPGQEVRWRKLMIQELK